MSRPFRIMVCDDQTTVRRLLMLLLSGIPGTEIAADVGDAETAWSVLVRTPVDLVLLDLELPGRHGFALLERIMRECPVPVLIISGSGGSSGAVRDQALALGAIGFVQKPDGVNSTHETLAATLEAHVAAVRGNAAGAGQRNPPVSAAPACQEAPAPRRAELPAGKPPLVAIGSSTGGIIAVIAVLKRLAPGQFPILITQHMLPGYAEGFAARLGSTTGHHVQVARGGEPIVPGLVLVAPSGQHLAARREGGRILAALDDRDKVSGHRPSCDVLFHAVAEAAGAHAIGVILTGMGRDGTEGLMAMRQAGARTLAQDKDSCVVFGMPKAALEAGAAERAVPLDQIGAEITALAAQGHCPLSPAQEHGSARRTLATRHPATETRHETA